MNFILLIALSGLLCSGCALANPDYGIPGNDNHFRRSNRRESYQESYHHSSNDDNFDSDPPIQPNKQIFQSPPIQPNTQTFHPSPIEPNNQTFHPSPIHQNTQVYQASPIDNLKSDEAFLEASQVSESKCHLDYIEKLNILNSYYSHWKPTFVPELKIYIREQVQVCEPYFVDELEGAVAQFNDFERRSISVLMDCMARAKQAFANETTLLHFEVPKTVLLEGVLSFLDIQASILYEKVTMNYYNYRQIFEDLVGGLCRRVEIVLDQNPLIESYNLLFRTCNQSSDEEINPIYLDWIAVHRVCRKIVASLHPYRSKTRIDDEAFQALADRVTGN